MIALDDSRLVLSATDLTNHRGCPHLTQQRLAVARGERGRPRPAEDPHADLIRRRGDAHEAAQLALLVDQADGDHLDLSSRPQPFSLEELESAQAETLGAMRAGRALISQGQLFDGRWQGRPDVLRRVPIPSALGAHSYEILDMKLARRVKPHVVHQLSLYNRLLGRLQGLEPPVAFLVLGDGSIEQVHLGRYAALHRRVVARLEAIVDAPAVATYPEPVAHCAICALQDECRARLVADDHLSLVAGARRDQRDRLVAAGLPTVAALGAASPGHSHDGLAPERFELLRHQAALQVAGRRTGEPCHRQLAPEPGRGYARLPAPSPGDVFFDLEGDPYAGAEGGIEYLWGWWSEDAGYDCVWGHDLAGERAALERFVRVVSRRRRDDPSMHVYHYAPHEASTLKGLALRHATCEEEVDELLRTGVLVDLYAVVRQALQVGEESYSLKRLERHHGFRRLERSVREGGGSIIAYETWLQTGDATLLEAIRAYNEEDCRSTWSLREWLHHRMRPEAVAEFGADALSAAAPPGSSNPPPWLEGVRQLIARLEDGLPVDPAFDDAHQAERRLLAQLVLYHYRESKPQYWRYFELREMTPVELLDERDALSGLVPDPGRRPTPFKRSLDHALVFPAQEFKLGLGDVEDPTTGASHTLVAVAGDHVRLRCAATRPAPTPGALIAGGPPQVTILREAIVHVAERVLAGSGDVAAARSILRREPPRLASGELGPTVDQLVSATLGLQRSHLPVQGPPGTGKTFRGARMIVEAIRAGRLVGVTAFSHAAIHNLLRDVEACASESGVTFAGVYKGDGYESAHGLVDVVGENADATGDFQLVAGTAWLLSRPQWRGRLSLVFVDEAGQFSLASAIAVSTAADSVVLLGDPQQLPQVTQAAHPGTSGASVLEHLLDGRATIAPDRGVLLDESWRMHPDVCAFVSERSYDSRLRSRPACARRRIDAAGRLCGAGLRIVSVEHEGRSQASEEEAEAIAALCDELLEGGSTVTGDDGETAPLRPADIMVVAPYNLAVQCIARRVPDGVRVGTVDRFQGRQAPVVFFAMTCSSGEDVPRGLDFLFSRNRLNVAISRAQCLAVVVAGARLLDADCHSLETMELVDGVCRFTEMATAVATPPANVP
jgi:uncharacterized protein